MTTPPSGWDHGEMLLASTPCVLNGIDWDKALQWMSKQGLRNYYQQYIIQPEAEKWDFNDFGRQIARMYTGNDRPFPDKAVAYLDAQTALLDIADAEGFKVQTRLKPCHWHSGAIELLARFSHHDERLDMRMVIDPEKYGLERSMGAYTGVYRMRLTNGPEQYRYETFRHRELAAGFANTLREELLHDKACSPMNFATIMDSI